ncbi:M15 family metallopeptidase [Rheinheimera baltica]|uniref:M15 family metallopeptidase n=1 Tax=Rheinheimera baltica TaxID=67576 RepID=UPI00273F979A|nr:M15 family metallopeptidase [Rheinheimera baltica]MDP5142772.1 M15 family metallopeptidase [Rheinheimera baltica]MDP5188716.1 M15 family metallopeptidase [Rheinheimera baltica]
MSRDTALEHLHPTFRQKIQQLQSELTKADLPFRLFEGFRSAQRQHQLYSQGRTTRGAKVTNADAWSSFHQYGVAADFVLFIDGKWSWDDKGPRKAWWQKLHELAATVDLEPLSWELPHLQQKGQQLAQLKAGHYPAGGDSSWAENLQQAILDWRGSPSAPPVPDAAPNRPELSNATSLSVDNVMEVQQAVQARVTARDGLRLRAGPGTSFDIKSTLKPNQLIYIMQHSGDWSQIDIQGDGLADGYCHSGYLAALR